MRDVPRGLMRVDDKSWKRGSIVYCERGHEIPTAGVIEHGVPVCRVTGRGFRQRQCGLASYIVVLSRNPTLFAYVAVREEQRLEILRSGMTPLQALWYLQLPMPLEASVSA